jgi:hypothetical protein
MPCYGKGKLVHAQTGEEGLGEEREREHSNKVCYDLVNLICTDHIQSANTLYQIHPDPPNHLPAGPDIANHTARCVHTSIENGDDRGRR